MSRNPNRITLYKFSLTDVGVSSAGSVAALISPQNLLRMSVSCAQIKEGPREKSREKSPGAFAEFRRREEKLACPRRG